MDRIKVYKNILSIVEKEYGIKNLSEDTNIFDDIGLDSFSFILFMVEVEKKFIIELIDRDVDWYEITHIKNLVDLVVGVISE